MFQIETLKIAEAVVVGIVVVPLVPICMGEDRDVREGIVMVDDVPVPILVTLFRRNHDVTELT